MGISLEIQLSAISKQRTRRAKINNTPGSEEVCLPSISMPWPHRPDFLPHPRRKYASHVSKTSPVTTMVRFLWCRELQLLISLTSLKALIHRTFLCTCLLTKREEAGESFYKYMHAVLKMISVWVYLAQCKKSREPKMKMRKQQLKKENETVMMKKAMKLRRRGWWRIGGCRDKARYFGGRIGQFFLMHYK